MSDWYGSVDSALIDMADKCLIKGKTVTVRGMETKELLMEQFTVFNPLNRIVFNPARNGNVFASIAETLWMLAGRDDLDWLERYIPQCKKWSDDGKTWRAAYGPRLRSWYINQFETVDQIAEVVKKLTDDPETRQAVISIWDPAEDWVEDSKDYPCNNWLHFIIRDNKLHLNVSIRSNDLIYGFSHNDFFSWSVLLQLMAHWVGVEVGNIVWNATSLHIYKQHYEKAQKIVDAYKDTIISHPLPPKPIIRFSDFDTYLNIALNNVRSLQAHIDYQFQPIGLLHIMRRMLVIYNYYLDYVKAKHNLQSNVRHLAIMVHNLPECDMKYAAYLYFKLHIVSSYTDIADKL